MAEEEKDIFDRIDRFDDLLEVMVDNAYAHNLDEGKREQALDAIMDLKNISGIMRGMAVQTTLINQMLDELERGNEILIEK